jgi:hypothetical protein
MLGHASHERDRLPSVPRQWPTLAVHLFGYESLGLEFAGLLATLRPDLASILEDEEAHVGFFERELLKLLAGGSAAAEQARLSARAWWRKLPRTLERYLEGEALAPFRGDLRRHLLASIERRFVTVGLLPSPAGRVGG